MPDTIFTTHKSMPTLGDLNLGFKDRRLLNDGRMCLKNTGGIAVYVRSTFKESNLFMQLLVSQLFTEFSVTVQAEERETV